MTYNIIDVISEPVIIIDSNGKINFINAAAGKFKNLHSPPLEVGGFILDSVQFQWKEITRGVIEKVVSSVTAISFETQYSIEGRIRNYDVICSPIVDGNNNVAQIIIEIRDITVQKIFERKIKESVFERSSLSDFANVLIIGVDTQGNITEWNNFAAEVTGFSKQETLTKNFLDLLLDFANRYHFLDMLTEIQSGKVVSNYELSIHTKHLKQLNILINATSKKNSAHAVVGILIIGQDITELSEYKRSLEQKVFERTVELQIALEKEKELVEIRNRFVSIASHELRSPISVIVRHANSLMELVPAGPQDEATMRLEGILHKANHMMVLLEDVLLIGRGEAAKIEPNVSAIELRDFFESTIQEVHILTGGSHAIKVQFPFDALIIESDESLLRNIFINLLNNAIKFSPSREEVFMNAELEEEFVNINIIDHGIGIAASELVEVFQPFNRGSNTGGVKGTGLGLSIAKKATETLGGHISVTSELGAGSIFTVRLKRIYAR